MSTCCTVLLVGLDGWPVPVVLCQVWLAGWPVPVVLCLVLGLAGLYLLYCAWAGWLVCTCCTVLSARSGWLVPVVLCQVWLAGLYLLYRVRSGWLTGLYLLYCAMSGRLVCTYCTVLDLTGWSVPVVLCYRSGWLVCTCCTVLGLAGWSVPVVLCQVWLAGLSPLLECWRYEGEAAHPLEPGYEGEGRNGVVLLRLLLCPLTAAEDGGRQGSGLHESGPPSNSRYKTT